MASEGFEVLAHTADTGFRAWALDLRALFEVAARAMFSLEYDPAGVPLECSQQVSVQGEDAESALYAWLAELIWLHDALGFVPATVQVSSIGPSASGEGWLVVGSALGADIGEWFVQTGAQLKAVTMHGLSVVSPDPGPGPGRWQATVYLDV